jgi:hypothetical protein
VTRRPGDSQPSWPITFTRSLFVGTRCFGSRFSGASHGWPLSKHEVLAKSVANSLLCVAAGWYEFGIDSRVRPAR